MMKKYAKTGFTAAVLFTSAFSANATQLSFEIDDFGLTPMFNDLRTFAFNIDVQGPLIAGQSYINPALNAVTYNVFGELSQPTPSGFSAFDLQRTIGGSEFYSQGSALSFSISAGADLSDGLQASELEADGNNRTFLFDGREVGTGRYHPSWVELFADGSGLIQNSNNFGGINPGNGQMVDVDYAEEYLIGLSFTPNALTLAETVPTPMSSLLLLSGLGLLGRRRKRSAL